MAISQIQLKQIIKEELRKVLKEEQEAQVSSEQAEQIINDPTIAKKLLKLFAENPQIADKIIKLDAQVNSNMEESKNIFDLNYDDIKAFRKDPHAAMGATATNMFLGLPTIIGPFLRAPSAHSLSATLASAAGITILAYLADVAAHAKDNKKR
jgi:hypothetical protein